MTSSSPHVAGTSASTAKDKAAAGPGGRSPTAQTPAAQVAPAGGRTVKPSRPATAGSRTTTSRASEGPLLLTVTVHATRPPATAVSRVDTLATVTSAAPTLDPETLVISTMTNGETRIPPEYEPRLARSE